MSDFLSGTRKWNAIEHELFSAIILTWQGRLLATFETAVHCIGHTKIRRAS